MKNILPVPKISLTLVKNSQKTHLRPTLHRTRIFIRNKAEDLLKNDYSITIQVTYGYVINHLGKRVLSKNSGTYKSIEDLRWAYLAFVSEYL